jgi:hypothetical protein
MESGPYDFAQERRSVAASSPPSAAETDAHTLQVRLLCLLGPRSGVRLFQGVFSRRSAGAPTADVMRWTAAAFCPLCRAILPG